MVNIKHAILYTINLHIPKVKIKSHNYPKWYNSDIRHHLYCIHTLRKSASHALQFATSQNLKLSETQLQHKMLATKANIIA